MRTLRLSFLHMLKFVRKDKMLFAAMIAPVLAGIAIHFVIPVAEKELTAMTGKAAVLAPYYSLVDVFFASLTPVMYCFIAAMVVLEEHDDNIDCYLFVTGLGRNGYFISRIVLPTLFAFVITVALLPVFGLTELSVVEILFLSLAGSLQGIIIALMITTLSTNKLEGMAVTKVSSLLMLGAFVPYFVSGPLQYGVSFLPSFWMGKALDEQEPLSMILTIVVAGIWLVVMKGKYDRR